MFSTVDNFNFIHSDDNELFVHLKSRRDGMLHLSMTTFVSA